MHKIRFHKRHIISATAILVALILGILALLLSLQMTKRPTIVHTTPPLTLNAPILTPQLEDRANYLAAMEAWQAGDIAKYHQLMRKLKNYPLYPYLVFQDLLTHIDTLSPQAYEDFVNTYQDPPLNKALNQAWLAHLAEQQQWDIFTQYYSPSMTDANLTCFYGQALIATGQIDAANQLATKLWLVSHPQPHSCDPVFAYWIIEDKLTVPLMWQRFMMAMQVDGFSVAKHVMSLMPAEQQLTANLWLKMAVDPKKITDLNLFPANTESNNAILTDGVIRIAKHDPKAAIKAWEILKKQHDFTEDQAQNINLAITTKLIQKDPALAEQWVNQINSRYINQLGLTDRLQLALARQNWPMILNWSHMLPASEKSDPAWQYWEARALAETGQLEAAKQIWQQLATLRNYYGFLAAAKIGAPFALNDYQMPIDDVDLARVAAIPGIARAAELFALDQINEGNSEWWAALDVLPEEDRYLAAHLAADNGWYSIALATTGKIAHKDDLRIRFPTFYQGDIIQAAALGGLNPAFIFAIIRQESLFNPIAESGVGAQGLMQLMMPTVHELIQKNKLPSDYADKLGNPSVNIILGGHYLSWLQQQVKNPVLMAAAYNAGIGRVRSWLPDNPEDTDIWIDRIPFTQTRDYVKNVVSYAVVYQYILGQQTSLTPFMPLTIQKDKDNAS